MPFFSEAIAIFIFTLLSAFLISGSSFLLNFIAVFSAEISLTFFFSFLYSLIKIPSTPVKILLTIELR